jgi:hypothetical protein
MRLSAEQGRFPSFHESFGVARAHAIWRRIRSALPALFVTLFALKIVWPVTQQPLISHDHPVHLFKAWQFFNAFLRHGHLTGWSHNWSFGYPASEFVPCGGELWIAAFRIVTLGMLSWEHTYVLAFMGVFVVCALAVYAFTREYFGIGAGTLAAVFFTIDPGDLYQGGWLWLVDFGVWPIALSCAFAILAYPQLERVLASTRRRPLILGTLLIAASIVTHQIALLFHGILLPVWLLDYWARSSPRPKWTWVRSLTPYVLGAGMAGFSTIPFLFRSHMALDLGVPGTPVKEIANSIFELRVFSQNWALIVVCCLIGFVRAFLGGGRGRIFMAAGFGVCLLLSSDLLINTLHFERVLPGIAKVEWSRAITLAKLFGYPLAGYGLVSALAGIGGLVLPLGRGKRVASSLLVVSAVGVFAGPLAKAVYENRVQKTYAPGLSEKLQVSYELFNDWALHERRRSSEHYRIAYPATSLVAMQAATPRFNDTPAYMIYGTPSQVFNRYPCSMDQELLDALGVKYVVADKELSEPDFVLQRTFGPLRVYSYTRYNKDPFTVVGPGEASLSSWSSDSIKLHLRGTGPETRLKLHVARYDRWQAMQAGKVLPIRPATAKGHEFPYLMEVDARDGELEFRYVQRPLDWLGTAVSSASVLGLLFLIARRPTWRLDAQLLPLLAEHSARIYSGASVVVASLIIVILMRWNTRAHLLPSSSLFHDSAAVHMQLDGKPCRSVGELDFLCAETRVQADYVGSSGGHHLCMTTPPTGHTLGIVFDTRLGSSLQIPYDPATETGNIKVRVNGNPIGEVPAKHSDTGIRTVQFDTRALAGSRARLEIEMRGGALSCFDATLIP